MTNIRYTIGTTRLGLLLVAVTEAGLCAIFLGDELSILLADLKRRFARATLVCDDPHVNPYLVQVTELIERPTEVVKLPLDGHGTDFQRRVWAALGCIPLGKTATYSQIATAIGQPAAVRAVARACAENPLAVVVPCHRIVRKDGNLAGYRWGVERKRALLEREQSSACGSLASIKW